ncbi:MAG: family 20 glycosylhydrolase, partial [Flavobacteriales bacterium]|nr:family 20 glycosylhydrolase [Flavobacteriales bacterium]
LNKFHFHFNDDEAWRLEIPGLPELTEYGARRGHTLDEKDMLHPAYGSGPDAFDVNSRGYGFFTRKEFIEILRYAKKLHIDVVPEIETPGHARAAVFSMKARYEKYKNTDIKKAEQYLMSDPDDTSKYTSAQAFHDNVMCVAREGVYNFLEKVVTEIQSMYTEADAFLPAIQTGGDEVPRGAWLGSPLCQKMVTDGKIATMADLRDYFTARFKKILDEKGLKYWGWMEIASKKGKPNPKFLGQGFMAFCWDTVGEWGGEQIPYILANAGYDIILCNAPNVYFDFAYGKSADEPGLYWGGWGGERLAFDLLPYDVYRSVRLGLQGAVMDWDTAPFKADGSAKEILTPEGKKHIRGIQGELWSETIKSEQMMQYYIFPKMFGLSERSWNASPAWADVKDATARNAAYGAAMGHYLSVIDAKGMSFLEKKGVDFRIAPPGIEITDSTLYISNSVPSGDVYYTTDGSTPTVSSKRWTAPVGVSGSNVQAITVAHGKKSSVSKYYAE